MSGTAASKASDAADELLAWLARQPKLKGKPVPDPALGNAPDIPGLDERAAVSLDGLGGPFPIAPASFLRPLPAAAASTFGGTLRLAATDWLFHRLTVQGPADDLRRFRRAASGSGMIPWVLDLDRMEEGYFHLLVAPDQRSLSVAGARIFARQLRDAVGRRHDLAVSQVDQSQVCPFDLHALCPVPHHILALGPDEPEALAWLWAQWGTTKALRHVIEGDSRTSGSVKAEDGEDHLQLSFWSADWTPWRALQAIGARWPKLRFDIRPAYDLP
jgi:hypothetical protein